MMMVILNDTIMTVLMLYYKSDHTFVLTEDPSFNMLIFNFGNIIKGKSAGNKT